MPSRPLQFDPANPYPLLPPGTITYAQAQEHAACVDAWLGLRAQEVETKLLAERQQRENPAPDSPQLWIGLPVQAMLTPYTELREMLARVNPEPGQRIVDLGAGYGRIGFVLARHYPGVEFLGYELAKARVEEGARVLKAAGASPAIQLVWADLSASDFRPSPASAYFIYDYGTRAAIAKTLEDLRMIARDRPITVIGRGRASRDAIERHAPWLSQVRRVEHCGRYSIYRS